jgi:hypothetical protein
MRSRGKRSGRGSSSNLGIALVWRSGERLGTPGPGVDYKLQEIGMAAQEHSGAAAHASQRTRKGGAPAVSSIRRFERLGCRSGIICRSRCHRARRILPCPVRRIRTGSGMPPCYRTSAPGCCRHRLPRSPHRYRKRCRPDRQTVRCPSLWIQTDSGRLHPCRISAPGYFRYLRRKCYRSSQWRGLRDR